MIPAQRFLEAYHLLTKLLIRRPQPLATYIFTSICPAVAFVMKLIRSLEFVGIFLMFYFQLHIAHSLSDFDSRIGTKFIVRSVSLQ